MASQRPNTPYPVPCCLVLKPNTPLLFSASLSPTTPSLSALCDNAVLRFSHDARAADRIAVDENAVASNISLRRRQRIETEYAAFGLSIGRADDSVRSTAGNAFVADPCRL